ncbi:MAG: group II intron maturase-specific domain-containing protein [Planctomycetota bacterium]
MKEIHRRIHGWHIQLRSDKTLSDLSRILNPILRGWYSYYGRFYPSALGQTSTISAKSSGIFRVSS